MVKKDALLEEITTLLAGEEGREDLERLERTLTDGYARALSLEAERRRLQKQIGTLSESASEDDAARRELAALVRRMKRQEGDLGALRDQLGRLRRRHSLAARSR